MAVSPQYARCFASASEAAGRQLSINEADDLFQRLQARMTNYMRIYSLSEQGAAMRAGKELGDEATLAAKIEKRSKQINLIVQRNLSNRVDPDRAVDSIMGLVTGFERKGNVRDAARSVDALGIDRVNQVIGPMTRELEQAGLFKALMYGGPKFGRDIGNELAYLNDPNWGKQTGNKFAAAAAKIMHPYLEGVRVMQNEAGAWIGKLDQYITRQSHDTDKILQMGFQAWSDLIYPKLDHDRTFIDLAPNEIKGWLQDVYANLATGNHEGANGADWITGFKGPQNLAKKVSENRKLFFKSADDWMDYNEVAGKGDIRSALFHQIEHGARNSAIMSELGTNPEAMLSGLVSNTIERLKDRGTPEALEQAGRLQREAGKYSGILEYAMRKGAGSEVPTFSNIAAIVRSFQDFLLGGFPTYISDIGTIGAMARHAGVSPWESYARSIGALLAPDKDLHELAQQLGQGTDIFVGSVNSKMRAYDGTFRGKLASLASTYEKWNGVKWWVRSQKEAAGAMLSGVIARNFGKAFDELPPRLQVTLRRYGIEENEWNTVRNNVGTHTLGGHEYFLPSDLHGIGDAEIGNLVGNAAPLAIQRGRQELVDKFSTFISDQVRVGLSEPTAGITRIMNFGNKRPATIGSEILKSVMQFKTFPMVHLLRSMTREMFRDGADLGGIAGLLAATTTLGYVSYSLKKLFRAQVPIIPGATDPVFSSNSVKALMTGLAQGGGLGIYGDFLFGDQSRFGGGIADTLAGPTYGLVNSLAQAFAQDKDTALEGKITGKKVATQAINVLKRNAPMINLFYARAALDYLILYSAQETINPGYLKRYERQLKQQQGVNFMLSPSTGHVPVFGR